MSSQYALRVKTKSGPQLIKHLGPTSTIKDLKAGLSAVSNISENRLHVLSGFPPRAFDLTQDDKCLKDSGLSSGDTLILEEKPLPAAASSQEKPLKTEQNASENINKLEYPGILMKKVVPADNSCLFSSFHFALNGNLDGSSKTAPMLREMIAGVIAADPESYSEAVLGRPNSEYCAWIQNDKSWGGAIEVSILSQYQGLEIVVVDTINAIINRFGEDQQYGTRILLLYDGIHYDPLYLDPMDVRKIIFSHFMSKISLKNYNFFNF